jgi:hypothetical protein
VYEVAQQAIEEVKCRNSSTEPNQLPKPDKPYEDRLVGLLVRLMDGKNTAVTAQLQLSMPLKKLASLLQSPNLPDHLLCNYYFLFDKLFLDSAIIDTSVQEDPFVWKLLAHMQESLEQSPLVSDEVNVRIIQCIGHFFGLHMGHTRGRNVLLGTRVDIKQKISLTVERLLKAALSNYDSLSDPPPLKSTTGPTVSFSIPPKHTAGAAFSLVSSLVKAARSLRVHIPTALLDIGPIKKSRITGSVNDARRAAAFSEVLLDVVRTSFRPPSGDQKLTVFLPKVTKFTIALANDEIVYQMQMDELHGLIDTIENVAFLTDPKEPSFLNLRDSAGKFQEEVEEALGVCENSQAHRLAMNDERKQTIHYKQILSRLRDSVRRTLSNPNQEDNSFIFHLLALSLQRAAPPADAEEVFRTKRAELVKVSKGEADHVPFRRVRYTDQSKNLALDGAVRNAAFYRQKVMMLIDNVVVMIAIVTLVTIGLVWGLAISYALPDSDPYVYNIFDTICFVVFFVEVSLRIWATNSARAFLFDPHCGVYNFVDFLVVLIDALFLFLEHSNLSLTGGDSAQYAKSARIVRLVRLLRLMKAARVLKALAELESPNELVRACRQSYFRKAYVMHSSNMIELTLDVAATTRDQKVFEESMAFGIEMLKSSLLESQDRILQHLSCSGKDNFFITIQSWIRKDSILLTQAIKRHASNSNTDDFDNDEDDGHEERMDIEAFEVRNKCSIIGYWALFLLVCASACV